MRKRLWSPDEDEKLQKYVSQHGFGNWSEVAKKTGLQRCGKSCRLRWINYLRPDLKRGKFSAEEKLLIVNLQKVFGNSWSKIAAHLPGRTDSDIKNFWHSHFRKKRPQQIIANPMCFDSFLPFRNTFHSINASHSHMIGPNITQDSSTHHGPCLNSTLSSTFHESSTSYLAKNTNSKDLSMPMFNFPHYYANNPNHSISLAPYATPFSLGPSNIQAFRCVSKQDVEGGNYVHQMSEDISSNTLPSMSEEDFPLYNGGKDSNDDEGKEWISRENIDPLSALCHRSSSWCVDESKDHDAIIQNVSNASKVESDHRNQPCTNHFEILNWETINKSNPQVQLTNQQNLAPEGLDLVVWSCVNRPLQSSHHEQLLSVQSFNLSFPDGFNEGEIKRVEKERLQGVPL
ncbi:hypothetical protein KP509_25G018100 [Ceratopteris richardii]|uniref:Uncharacterized protein n=1 Tax=Ceratopteris richardii TaxID=49495 RepID=A0A8T2RPI7_CERRI|nr:hypothetical protein KP509_25G018100 [Ceratopteris richardii]KAH7297911.1 hypothetical protein KP509_25G018100 [Ceratopteris richardii]